MFKQSDIETWVVLNDLQIEWVDWVALTPVLDFIDDLRPHGILLNGDIVDCYAISDFTKDPMQDSDIASEIRMARKLMERLAKNTKERVWLGGNHEDRLRRYLWKNAPALARLQGTDFPDWFNLNDFGFSWKPYGGTMELGRLLVTHGDQVSKHSAFSAKAHFDKYGTSILHGHTHRLGVYYRTDVRGVHAAYENGCLCKLTPEYVQHPNWQQGFSVVHVDTRTRYFNVQQIPILDRGTFYYGSTRLGGGKSGR